MVSFEAKLPSRSAVKAFNAGFFISPGYGRHPVRQIPSCELIMVKSGTLGIYEEGRQFKIGAGQTLLLMAGREHGGTLDYAKDLQFYWIHFKFEENLKDGIELPQSSVLKRPERMVELFRTYLDDQESGLLTEARGGRLMELMLLETLEARPSGEALPKDSDETLSAQAENIISSRFHESSLSASKIAKALGCNPDYLNRVFKRARSCTLTEAIQRQRVKSAAQLLLDGSSSIKDAALRSGFSEHAYMRRIFKKIKGMTPKEYRLLHRRMHVNTR